MKQSRRLVLSQPLLGSAFARRAAGLLLLITWLLSIAARGLLVSAADFDGLYGQDAYAYYDYAVGPLRQSLLALNRLPPFTWPPGYPILVALSSLAVGIRPFAGQLVSFAAALLLPYLTAMLAWELLFKEDRHVSGAILSGLLVTVTGQLWQSSVVVMSDTAGLCLATLGALGAVKYYRSAASNQEKSVSRWLFLAAAATAFSILVRWTYALVAIPIFLLTLLALSRRPRKRAFFEALGSIALVLLILSPLLATILKAIAGQVGESVYAVDLQVVKWHPLNPFRNTFVTSDGALKYRLPNGLYYILAPAHRFYFTVLLAPFLLPGAVVALRRPVSGAQLILLGWPGAIALFYVGIAWQNLRFTLAYLPPLAILLSAGILFIAGRLDRRGRFVLSIWLAIGLIWAAIGGWRLTEEFVGRKQADLAAINWVAGQIESEAVLVTFGLTSTFQHYSDLETWELFNQTPDTLAELLESGRPIYLLLDVPRSESQWEGRAPSRNYRWLRDGPGLIEFGTDRSYTLFRVKTPIKAARTQNSNDMA